MSSRDVIAKINADGKISIVSGLLGIFWTFSGFKLGFWAGTSPGPGFFPAMVGVLAFIFSIPLFKQSISTEKSEERKKMSKEEMKRFVKIPLLTLITVFAMNYIGTFVSLFIFFIYWFKQVEKFTWLKTIITTFIVVITYYLIFVRWLQIPFPKFSGMI